MMCCVVAVQNKINALVVFIASTSAASVSLLLVRVVARLSPKIDKREWGGGTNMESCEQIYLCYTLFLFLGSITTHARALIRVP